MAFAAAAGEVAPPPGMVPPTTFDFNHMFQMMQVQLQQQQVQGQQVADLLKVFVSSQSTSLPSVGSTGHGTVKSLDERHFRRINKFDNKVDSWKEWRTHFLTSVRESSPITAKVLELAEMTEGTVMHHRVLENHPDNQEAET